MSTLRELLTTSTTTEQRFKLLEVVGQGCSALRELHLQGKTHGGIEPSRFFCEPDNVVRLLPAEEYPPVAYLSPEQLREDSVDQRSDLYSLGAVLYEVLTGRCPFEKASHPALVLAILTEAPASPSAFWPECPASLESLCLSLLSKESEHRPKNIQEVSLKLTEQTQESPTYFTPREEDSRPKAVKKAPPPRKEESIYEVKEEIGRGGAGRILRALDKRIGREIAIKESLSTTPIAIERFVREALITARLEHPGIVPIHETGHWPDGSPFYTMKLIDGRPLSEVIEGLSFQERVALLPRVLTAAEAISYAHSKGVIHRDLKPQNILIGDYGETVVIDWGLAKEIVNSEKGIVKSEEKTQHSSAHSSLFPFHSSLPALTQFGTILGTPAYMPLEQAEGKEVDERADVYALGAILYHLLSGVPPYDMGEFSSEALDYIRSEAPRPLDEVQPETPKDLCALVSKAMSRAPGHRYPSAKELCHDLDRFLRGGLVSAHRYSLGEILLRNIKRYRAAVTVAVLSLLVLSFFGVYSLRQILEAKTNAEENAALAEKNSILATKNEGIANQERGIAIDRLEQLALSQARALVERSPLKALGALKLLSPGSARWRAARIRASDIKQRGVSQIVQNEKGRILFFCTAGDFVATAQENNAVHLWNPKTNESRSFPEAEQAYFIACSPDGKTLAVTGKKSVQLVEIKTGQVRTVRQIKSEVLDMNFSPDSQQLAVAEQAGTVDLIDVQRGAVENLLTQPRMMRSVRFSPDQRYLASVGNTPYLYLYDLQTRTMLPLDNSGDFQRVRFSPDGKWIATASYTQVVTLWDVETKTSRRLVGHAGEVWNIAFSPDNKTLASVGQDKRLWLWDLSLCGADAFEDCVVGRALEGHQSSIRGVTFSSDGKWLVTSSMDRSIRLWDTKTWEARPFEGHEDVVSGSSFLPNDQQLVSHSWDGTVRLWELDNGERSFVTSTGLTRNALSPDGQWIATLFDLSTARLTNTKTGEIRSLTFEGAKFQTNLAFVFSPDSQRLLTFFHSEMFLWDLQGKLLARQDDPQRGRVYQAVFSPDGQWIAAACANGTTTIWSPAKETAFTLSAKQGDTVGGVGFSPDGKYLSTVGAVNLASQTIPKTMIWETGCFLSQDCQPLYTFENPAGDNSRPIFSPDGRLLTITNVDLHSVIVFTLATQREERLAPHGTYSLAQVFSPDGKILATSGLDTAIRLWDTSTWEYRELRGHQNFVKSLAFSPDGQSLVSGGFDQTIRIWDIASGESRVLAAPDNLIIEVYYSPSGDELISVSDYGVIRIWADNLPTQAEAFWEWLAKTPAQPSL